MGVVSYADDLLLLVEGGNAAEVKSGAERSLVMVEAWLSGMGWKVAKHKTELVVV